MKKLLLVVAALAVAAPVYAGTGGNPKPKDRAPETTSHSGSDQSQVVTKTASPKAEKPAAKSGE
jgi:hypothetical protein